MKTHNAALLAALMCVASGARAQNPAQNAAQTITQIASAKAKVPIAARDIARGTALAPLDIRWADTTLSDGSVPQGASVAPGWVARRVIHAGEILQEPGVAMPDLVRPGDAVDVVYSTAGVAIRVRGTAIGRGVKGDEVYVRLDNRRRLRGIIAGPNTVRVM